MMSFRDSIQDVISTFGSNEGVDPVQISDEVAPIHAMSLASNLYNLYKDSVATDVKVVCQEEAFKLHSAVLIHGSPYFKRILESTKNNDEQDGELLIQTRTFNLEFNPPIEPSTFDIVIESLYTGRVSNMTEDNITSLLEAYYHLEINYAYDTCVQFMLRHLDMDNCLTYWLAGKCCHSTKVRDKAIGLMGRHLDSFYTTQEFLELNNFTIIEILSQDALEVPNEEIVFEAAMAWIKYDEENRASHTSEILDVVRLTYLPAFYLVNVVGKEDLIENDRDAMSMYSKALKCKLANKNGDQKQRHHSIHAVKGTIEKVQKQQSKLTSASNDSNNCFAGCKEKITFKRKAVVAVDDGDYDNDDKINEIDFEEDNEDRNDRTVVQPGETEKPKNFIQQFFDNLKKKNEKKVETNDPDDVIDFSTIEVVDENQFDENQFTITYTRLEGVPEECDEDLSVDCPSKNGSYTGLSYSHEEIDKPMDEISELDVGPSVVEDLNSEQAEEDEQPVEEGDKLKEGELLTFEIPQDIPQDLGGKENVKTDEDSFGSSA